MGTVITNDFAEFRAVVLTDRCIKGSGTQAGGFQLRELGPVDADFFRQFVIGGLPAKIFGHGHRDPAHLGNLVHHVNGEADRLGLVGEGAFDGLFDPPSRVGGKFAAFVGVKPFYGLHQTNVSFRNQIQERQAIIGVVLRNFDHKAEVGLDHVVPGGLAAGLNFCGEFDFLLGCQERSLPNLPQINFDASIKFKIGHGCKVSGKGFGFEGL